MRSEPPPAGETPADRFRCAIDLFEVGLEMFKARYRREHPDATDARVETAVRDWLRDRPDAPHGDYPGPPSTREITAR